MNRVVGIITARGNSKGIPRKNLRRLNGKPLIEHTFEAAKASRLLDETILSTDNEEIANFARECGISVPFIRPKELASDEASSIDVVVHALQYLRGYEHFVLLQPTSPLRSSVHIDEALEIYLSSDMKSLVSVSKVTEHPNWMYKKNEDGSLSPFMEEPLISRRQDLPDLLIPNGAIYVRQINDFLQSRKMIGPDTFGFTMKEEDSIDIDSEVDLAIAEVILNSRNP